jgi:hypothetical protein
LNLFKYNFRYGARFLNGLNINHICSNLSDYQMSDDLMT